MITLIKNIINRLISFFRFPGKIILMYHSVGNNGEFFTVKPKDFERQMEYLYKKKFNVIRLTDMVNFLEKKIKPPRNSIVLTFDDGYEDNFTEVFKILKKFNFPATIFLSTALLDGKKTNKSGTSLNILNEKQIREMYNSGLFDFEPHTHNHRRLTEISIDEAENEISRSKRIIEDMLDKKCVSFAYPYGAFNKEIAEMTKDHFRAILGVRKGRVDLSSDLFELKRNSVDSAVGQTQFRGIVRFGRI